MRLVAILTNFFSTPIWASVIRFGSQWVPKMLSHSEPRNFRKPQWALLSPSEIQIVGGLIYVLPQWVMSMTVLSEPQWILLSYSEPQWSTTILRGSFLPKVHISLPPGPFSLYMSVVAHHHPPSHRFLILFILLRVLIQLKSILALIVFDSSTN